MVFVYLQRSYLPFRRDLLKLLLRVLRLRGGTRDLPTRMSVHEQTAAKHIFFGGQHNEWHYFGPVDKQRISLFKQRRKPLSARVIVCFLVNMDQRLTPNQAGFSDFHIGNAKYGDFWKGKGFNCGS